MKKPLILILLLLTYISTITGFALEKPTIYGEAGILIDFTTGEVLYEKNPHKSMYPASTTKILTALIILETHDLDEEVIIESTAPFIGGSRIYVVENEVFTVEQLLYATLIESANDAAVALAIHHSGSVEAFADVMNAKAIECGALNSNFVNPNGLPDENHTTTAYDLAMIAKKAMEIQKFRELVSTQRYQIPPTNKVDEIRYLKSKNRLLHGTGSDNLMKYNGKTIEIKYDLVDGIKTGYTGDAKNCFVGTAEDNGFRLISVVLKSKQPDVFSDTRYMLDYGFNGFKRHTFTIAGNVIDRKVIDEFKKTRLTAISKETITKIIAKDTPLSNIEKKITYNEILELPIYENDVIGKVEYIIGGELFGTTDLLSANTVEDTNLVSDITNFLVRTDSSNQLDYKFYINILINLVISLLIWRTLMTMFRVNKRKRK